MVTQGLLWGYSRGQFGGSLGPSLGILKINLEVLWSHFGGTLGSYMKYSVINLMPPKIF